ncbi:MAG TPA: ABC transporter permease [Anaerolineales bacterium]|nr:ABC transporter permease [Anaerolineales bacterium]
MHRRFHRSQIKSSPGWVFVLPSLVLVVLIGLPLFALVWRSIGKDFFTYALSENAFSALKLSLLTSSISVGLGLLTGTPLAYLLARWKFPGHTLIDMLVDVPVVLPPAVAGIALLMAFGRMGILGRWLNMIGITIPFTTVAVVIAQSFVATPFLVRSAKIGFAAIDPQLQEAAWIEGANEWQVFRYVMIPIAGRALLTGVIMSWTRSLGEFGATILFAGNLEGTTQTMPLAIYVGFEQDMKIALTLSVMLLAVSLVFMALLRRLEEPSN